MKRRHRRRIPWGWLTVLTVAASFGLAVWWFGYGAVERALPVVAAAGGLLYLAALWRQKGIPPSPGSVVAVGAASFFTPWVFFWLDARWYTKVALLLIGGSVLSAIANALVRGDAREAQGARDELARQIVKTVKRDAKVPTFALYLRPFLSTDHLPAQPLPHPARADEVPVHLDIEALLARALHKDCPLIALGREGEMLEGAGRVTEPESDWQEAIERLIHSAAIVVVLPSANPGTLWELQTIVGSDVLGKSLFLMPEQLREAPSGVWSTAESDRVFDVGIRRYSAPEHHYDFAAEWAAASASAEHFGLHLPPYAAAGALFVVDRKTRRMARGAPLALSLLARRSSYLRAAVRNLGLLPADEARDADLLDAFEGAVGGGRRTLEYALVVAADTHLRWGDVPATTGALRRAALAGGRRARTSVAYVGWMEQRANDLLADGDGGTACTYLETIAPLVRDVFHAEPSVVSRVDATLSRARELGSIDQSPRRAPA